MRLRNFNTRYRGVRLPDRVEWDYVPTSRQLEFHRCAATYKLYGGAMGGGKTKALCAEAVKQSLKFPGNRGYFCRQELIQFKRSTLVTFENTCPAGLIRHHSRDDRTIELRNGSTIVYGGLGGDEDIEKLKSTEFGWFAVDESTETSEEMFQLLCSRLRWRLPNGKHPVYHGLLASNPEPGWVKDRFVDRRLADHAFIPALPKDNPYNPPDYAMRLRKQFPAQWVKRYVEGSWDVFEGQIYTEFDRLNHVVRDIKIGQYWERMRVIDHGYTNPTAVLWIAVDHDGRMWVYDEHYERAMTIREHARIIKMKDPNFAGVTLCDPSMFNRGSQREGKPWSHAAEYRDNGIVCISPYSRDGYVQEGVGINLVKQRLKSDMLFVHERCQNFITEILKYRWKMLKAHERAMKNTPEEPVDKDNHAMDALRYACCWRPLGSPVPRPPDVVPGTLHWWIMQHKGGINREHYAGWN